MSTGAIIAIVVIALILLALLAFVLPRARRNSQVKARERELEDRRERVVGENRAEAEERSRQAEVAEQKAQMAEAEAKRERAEAEMREQRAQMHERGMADDELIDESERDRFAGTSAARDEPGSVRDDDRDRVGGTRDEAGTAGDDERPMHEPRTESEQGRVDEREKQQER